MGTAIQGYDAVEYFSLAATADGVKGDLAFSYNLTATDGSSFPQKLTPTNYTFLFKDEANRDTFAADPWRYAPKWGGF